MKQAKRVDSHQMKRSRALWHAALAVCLAVVLPVSLLTSCSDVDVPPPAEQSTPTTEATSATTAETTATTVPAATATTVKVTMPPRFSSLTADLQQQTWVNAPDIDAVSASCADFAVSLLQYSYSGHGNTATSPLALYTALAMLYNGAAGQTAQEFSDVLGGSSAQINAQLGTALRRMEVNSSKRKVQNAASLWLHAGYPVEQTFLQTVVNAYDADVLWGDMASAEAVQRLNSWVNDKTEGRIPQFLDKLPANTTGCIVTTQLFSDSWKRRAYTLTEPFYETDGTTVDTAFLAFSKNEGNLTAYISDEYTVAICRMEGSYMLFVMPHEGSAASLLGRMRGEQLLSPASFGGAKHTNIRLYFPQFKTTSDTDYKDALSAMGLSSLFSFGTADLTALGAPLGSVALDGAKVKTVFETTTDGVDAAAAAALPTIIKAATTGQKPAVPLDVKINRSFLYAVIDSKTNIPLYIGVYDTAK